MKNDAAHRLADQLDLAQEAGFVVDVGIDDVEGVDAGDTRIVVDIRDNPGGYLSTALQVISEFVGDGVAYMEEDSKGQRTVTNVQSGGLATDPRIRVVLLVNAGSASASEIFAGGTPSESRYLRQASTHGNPATGPAGVFPVCWA